MLSVEQALKSVLQHSAPLPPADAAVADALGLVLAEEIASDIDSPPHDKALMDGYAVRSGDLVQGAGELVIVEEVTAGAVPSRAVGPGQATRIMTGAPIPSGADAVVMVEQTQIVPDQPGGLGRVRIQNAFVSPGKNIMPRGRSMHKGETVLAAGSEIRPVEIGLLSEIGRSQVAIIPRPRVAVLPTGDEVVEPSQMPGLGQIRNSNGPMIAALITRAGGLPIPLGIGRDDRDTLRAMIGRGLEHDVLILSGGVSAGIRDLVPEVLAEWGVEAIFHHVRLKPGKPLLFGTCPRPLPAGAPANAVPGRTLVFGLPGNPVSGLVCFELFVRPALRRLAGHVEVGPRFVPARLSTSHQHRGDRPTYHPALLTPSPAGWTVAPVPWQGSPDLRGVSGANALLHFPAGDRDYLAGETLEALEL